MVTLSETPEDKNHCLAAVMKLLKTFGLKCGKACFNGRLADGHTIFSWMNFELRRAEQRDCPAILELVQALAIYEKAPEAVTVSLQDFEAAGFGEKPIWWGFVAVDPNAVEAGKRIVGFALYYIRFSTWKGPRMYLEDIFVQEAWRGQGVGKALMDRLMDTAKKEGFKGMNWQVLEWNQTAIDFYKRYNCHFDAAWENVSLEL